MSHQILYARSNSGRAGLSTASIVHDLLMLYLALMIFDRSCGFDLVHQLSTASIVHDLLMLYLALMIFDRSCGFDLVHQYKAVNDQ